MVERQLWMSSREKEKKIIEEDGHTINCYAMWMRSIWRTEPVKRKNGLLFMLHTVKALIYMALFKSIACCDCALCVYSLVFGASRTTHLLTFAIEYLCLIFMNDASGCASKRDQWNIIILEFTERMRRSKKRSKPNADACPDWVPQGGAASVFAFLRIRRNVCDLLERARDEWLTEFIALSDAILWSTHSHLSEVLWTSFSSFLSFYSRD